MASFTRDPLSWVIFSFPWGVAGTELEKFSGPEEWQKKLLIAVRDGLISATQAIQLSTASGNGVGKSALVAWLIIWGLSTHEDTRGVVTANTEAQLRTKTWAELAKWHRLFIARHWFVLTATAIYSVQPSHEKTWRIDQVPWSETNPEAFAGLHNKGNRIVLIMDEASAIPDIIWEVAEGALTDKDTEIIWAVFGNPTRNDGRFSRCFSGDRHRWITQQIDSRTVSITNKTQINQWIQDYGEDSDFVRVRVRGVFPNVSDRQFIPSSYVEVARTRFLSPLQYNFAAKIISVEPSWTGGDEFVIGMRQGNMFKVLAKYTRNDDDFVMAGYVANFEDREFADAVFVDLGYGTGIVSAGKQLKRNWMLVPFGGASNDPGYLNKRAEMWGLMKSWLGDGGAIDPADSILAAQICSPEYYVKSVGVHAGKTVLEAKEDMKKRGVESPNRADALALTFAFPVAPKNRFGLFNDRAREFVGGGGTLEFAHPGRAEYDPLKHGM